MYISDYLQYQDLLKLTLVHVALFKHCVVLINVQLHDHMKINYKSTLNMVSCIDIQVITTPFYYLSQSWSHFVCQSSSDNHHISLALNKLKVLKIKQLPGIHTIFKILAPTLIV